MNTKTEKGSSVCDCETCCKQIPKSAAVTAEGADYVKYFCSPECYDKYHLHKKNDKPKDTKDKE